MEQTPSKLTPALIGGGIMAVLSAFPIISMGNCVCCMWILLGGAVSAYLYAKQLTPKMAFSSGQAAVCGLLAGLFGALFSTFLGYLFKLVFDMDPMRQLVQGILESRSNMTPEMEEVFETIQEEDFYGSATMYIILFGNLVVDTIFGTLGGIIGGAIVKKKRNDHATKKSK